jgi:hypothetical protein
MLAASCATKLDREARKSASGANFCQLVVGSGGWVGTVLEQSGFSRTQTSKEWAHAGDSCRYDGPVELSLRPDNECCKL